MSLFHKSGVMVSGDGLVKTVTGATTLTDADSGKVILLDAAAGATVTLPTVKDNLRFKFIVAQLIATTPWTIDSAEGDNINGILVVNGASVAAVGEDQINIVETAEALGDWVELVGDGTNSQWLVSGVGAAAGSITATDPS